MKTRTRIFRGFVIVFLLAGSLKSAPRKVLAELFTNTSCSSCAPANPALDDVYQRHHDIMTVIRYHVWWPSPYDPFYQSNIEDNTTRTNYYGVSGVPNLRIDGLINAGYQYGNWESQILDRAQIESPILLQLQLSYDSTSRTGQIIAFVTAEQSADFNNLHLRYALVEDNVHYNASNGEDIHNQVMRDMLPDADGVPINIQVGQTVVDTQSFSVDTSWVAENCQVVVFVQNDQTKEVYQSDLAFLMPYPKLRFIKYRVVDGNNNYPEPGETVSIYPTLINDGHGVATGVEMEITSDDPFIEVTSGNITYGEIGIGQSTEALQPVQIAINSSVPDSYFTYLGLTITTTDGFSFHDSLPVMIDATPGFSDDMESGEGNWTYYGTIGQWHLTEHRSHTPTHSWYNGVEYSWTYYNNSKLYLESPFILVSGDSLEFWHWYSIETNYDFGYLEVSGNGTDWIPLDSYTGNSSTWIRESYSLSDYIGSPVKIRFRFSSDGDITSEGWYIDDILLQPVGVSENGLQITPPISIRMLNPLVKKGEIQLAVANAKPGVYRFSIYNVSGALQKEFSLKLSNITQNKITLDISKLLPGLYLLTVRKSGENINQLKFIVLGK